MPGRETVPGRGAEAASRAGPGTPAAHEVWERIFAIKTSLGLNGQATSLLLLEPSRPEAVLAELGYSPAAVAALRESGVIQVPPHS